MSTNRPFLANFLAAFRAQSTYKASAQNASSLSSTQMSQSARTIATKAGNNTGSAQAAEQSSHHYGSRPHSHTRTATTTTTATATTATATEPASPTPGSSNPIPIANTNATHDRQRRGSDSSSGSGGFRDALGPEKWYIGGRSPGGEERFYRLGMVTKGGGRLGGSGRVGSIDQLSL